MIYGIGIDVLKVDRIERVFEKYRERFIDHLLMPEERFVALWKSEASLSTVADFFAVSYGAAEKRFKRLKRERKL